MSDKKKPIMLKADSPLDDAVSAFNSGGVIAYPTETTYALGVDPFNIDAVERLFALKKRPEDNPLSILVADRKMLSSVVDEIPECAEALIRRFWPGPLTLVFKANKRIPAPITAGTGTIGVRISSSAICARLLKELKKPITATSANPSGAPSAESAAQVLAYFNGSIEAVIDHQDVYDKAVVAASVKPSTVVDVTGKELRLIREGAIEWKNITLNE